MAVLDKNGTEYLWNKAKEKFAAKDDVPKTPEGVVLYTEQSLTDSQKAQARGNIGAVNSWEDLEDKPFGDAEVALIEEQTIPVDAEGSNQITATDVPIPGSNVTVFWDGVEYNCTAINFNGASYVGNTVCIGGADTGEPFAFMFVSADMVFPICADPNKTSATVKVIGLRAEKLNKKYIDVVTTFYIDHTVDNYLYVDSGLTTKATLSELSYAMKSSVVLFVGNGGLTYRGLKSAVVVGSNGYGVVELWDVVGGKDFKTFYTAEYTG